MGEHPITEGGDFLRRCPNQKKKKKPPPSGGGI